MESQKHLHFRETALALTTSIVPRNENMWWIMGSGRLLSLSTSSPPHLNLGIFVLLKAPTIELEFWVFMFVSIWGINGSTYSSIDTFQVERRLGIPTLEMNTVGGNFPAKLKNPNFGDFINGRIAYFKRIVVLYSCSPFVDL